MIVSVSRRCDIPRFQFKWFMGRIDAGYVEAVNPYNARQIKRISLVPAGVKPEDGVELFVFWTRNPRQILANADELAKRGFCFYVMTTVTGYPAVLEPSMVHASKVLNAMKGLAQKIGPERVIWRYDPVIISNITGEDFHRRNFSALARELSGSVKRVIISMYNEYPKTKLRFERLQKSEQLQMCDAGISRAGLLSDLAQCAQAAGMEIQSCASGEDFSPYGIKPGACIDGALINKLWGIELTGKDKYQRPHCLCAKSVDIGAYGICSARCVYCYAW
jgi:hypothetical protein